MEYAFQVDGPADAPPLLLVHGLLSSRDHWLPNLPRLSQHFRVIRIDLPAHGATPMPANRALASPDRLVDALDLLRRRLGIERWLVGGQSVGAGLTLRYALAHPERVLAQVFTNANAVLRDPPDAAQLEAHARRVALLRDPEGGGFAHESIHPRFARRFPDWMRARLVEGVARMDPPAFADFIDMVMPQISLRYYLPRMSTPTRLLNGVYERRFQPLRDWAATALPAVSVVDIEGGHSVNIENAAAFDEAAIAFLLPFADAATAARPLSINSHT